MSVDITTIRNIGIIAHIDAGKTTTTERILYYTGTSHRMGEVDHGTTITDFDVEEAKRGITIYSAAITCRWKNVTINIIDTPGHVDFTAEVERSLRVLDGGIVIFSAVEGVEAQSETVWRQADKYHVPRICFINKLDRTGADFERTFQEIKDRLGGQPIAIQIPIDAGSSPAPKTLRGIIDLIEMKALYFNSEDKGETVEVAEVPEEFQEQAAKWRQKLLETVSEFDDDIMLAVLEERDVPTEKIHELLRLATIQGQVHPTLCGAVLNYVGVQPLLDAVTRYLPSPLDRPPVTGPHPNSNKDRQIRRASSDEPFCGLVFKIVADQHTDFCFVRIYSGRLKAGTRVLNARTGKKELVSQIWHIQADTREKIETDQLEAGDIAGFIGPKEVVTGDTLCDPQRPILLESIVFPETVISMAVEPDSSAERKKLQETLQQLARQDPTFQARISEETGQTIISGMGELHLEVIRHRLERDFGLHVRVHKPRVSYRETIRQAVTRKGEFRLKSGEAVQYAKVTLRVEPFEGGELIALKNNLKPGTLPEKLSSALEQAILDAACGGGLVGYPLMKLRISIEDADYREGETTEVAVQQAAAQAMREAISEENVVLLEPIMKLEVVTPEDFLGNIQADLNARRAVIVSSERRGDLCVLESHVALSQMFGYSTQVRSLSQGRASYSMEPLKYDEAPSEVLRDMLG